MAEPFRILVTGSRHCTEGQAAMVREHLRGTLLRHRPPAVVVHGQCPNGGVDLVAHRFAERWPDAEPEPHPADWGRHGRAAGPIRNQAMVDLGADICLAFPAPGSRGTWDCIRRAADAGIPVQVWPLSSTRAALATGRIEDLIEASSLGTPGAKALRARTSPETAREIVARSKRMAPGGGLRAMETAEQGSLALTDGPEPSEGS